MSQAHDAYIIIIIQVPRISIDDVVGSGCRARLAGNKSKWRESAAVTMAGKCSSSNPGMRRIWGIDQLQVKKLACKTAGGRSAVAAASARL